MAEKYYKITNESENHFGYQYHDGLNILEESFNDDPRKSCCPGGFYFTNAKHILSFFRHGVYLREVELPIDDPEFKMILDPEKDKWRCNKIILGKRHLLSDIETLKMLVREGADTDRYGESILLWAAEHGYLEIIKYLIEVVGTKSPTRNQFEIILSAQKGYLEVVEYLMERGANTDNDAALIRSAENGHLDVVRFLLKHGAGKNVAYSVTRNAIKEGRKEIALALFDKLFVTDIITYPEINTNTYLNWYFAISGLLVGITVYKLLH